MADSPKTRNCERLPGRGAFPVRAPLKTHEVKNCHGSPSEHAPRRNLATARRWERTSRAFCRTERKGEARRPVYGDGRREQAYTLMARMAGSLAGVRRGSSRGQFARWGSQSGIARRNSRVGSTRKVSRAQKSAAPKNGAFPANYGRKPDPP